MLDTTGKVSTRAATTNSMASLADRVEAQIVALARCFRVEQLALAAFVSEDNEIVDFQTSQDILNLRKETKQLLKVVRFGGLYLVLLTLFYLFQSCYSLWRIRFEDFHVSYVSAAYSSELYGLTVAIERVKVVHALTLLSLALFIIKVTGRFKILNFSHYVQLGVLAILLSVVYFIPVLVIAHMAYSDYQQSEVPEKGAMSRFADILFLMMRRTDLGIGGIVFAIIIHIQIYFLLFWMAWCASHVRDIVERVERIKEHNSGAYSGLELEPTAVHGGDSTRGPASYVLQEDQATLGSTEEAAAEITEEVRSPQTEGDLLSDEPVAEPAANTEE